MALLTFGSAATTTLAAMLWRPGAAQVDIAQIAANIKRQANPTHPIVPGSFANGGRLELPGGRGVVLLRPGDYIAYDDFGWPIVVSGESIAGGSSWVHS